MIVLRCYDPSDDQAGGIHAWYDEQTTSHRGAIDAALRQLGKETKLDLAIGIKTLRGRCAGLSEVLIDYQSDNGVAHIRVIGFENKPYEFVLLCGFQKRGSADYGPACRSAHQRKLGVLKDGKRAGKCQFPRHAKSDPRDG